MLLTVSEVWGSVSTSKEIPLVISTPSLVQVEVVGGPPLVRASRVKVGLLPVNREPERRVTSFVPMEPAIVQSHRAKNYLSAQFISAHMHLNSFTGIALVCIILTLPFMFIESPKIHPSYK